ncbi:unnamed protein product, partial [Prunus brigantina]
LPYCLVIFLYVSSPNWVAFPSATSTSHTEANALLKWKANLFLNQALNNLTWYDRPTHNINATNSSSSNPKPRTSPCTWTGVSCNSVGSVSKLNLSSCSIQGTLHEFSFLSFPNLEYLNLSLNKLFDAIPPQISYLSKLHHLDLSHNDGLIPPNIGNLIKLNTLFLGKNQLSGLIPKEIGNLKSLVNLQLPYNNLSGLIPPNIGNLIKLNILYLGDNQLSGLIPKEIWDLKSLVDLDLSYNNLSGLIPPEIGNAIQIHVLDLSSNHLVGLIPKEFEKLSSLVKLMLNENQLSGRIPLEFGSLNDLEYLDLSTNKFSDSIPSIIGDLLKLHHLNLSNNKLSQAIPFMLGKLFQLNDLDLSHNSLEGTIPSEMGSMQSLVTLDLSHNNLSGSIPSSFEEMRGLWCVDISYNHLEGPLPNISAFREAPAKGLKGNKGLCGKVRALLPPCNAHGSKNHHKVIFSILAVFVLLSALFTIVFVIMQGKKKHQDTKQNHMHGEISFSVLNFDGKSMYEEIITATEDFNSTYCIGNGGHGNIYKVNLSYGDVVAVNKLHMLWDGNTEFQKEFLNEVRTLSEIRHRNIVKLYGFCADKRHSFLVYKYLERGSLAAMLSKDEEAKELGWSKRVNVVKGLAHALSYMHHDCLPPIVHRDFSSKNILLDSQYEACVSDFGTARFLNPNSTNWTAAAGTYGYMAPGNIVIPCSLYLSLFMLLPLDQCFIFIIRSS